MQLHMQSSAIFLPVLSHILMVLLLFIVLAKRKFKVAGTDQVNLKETAIDNSAWTPEVVKVSNNIANQFETPIVFYVLCLVTFATQNVTLATVSLAWAFVALRVFHAYVHIGSNYVPLRMRVFALSLIVLLVHLVYLAFNIISG